MICLYSSDKPKNINDIIIENYAMEHPYEKIAYEISEHIYNIHKIEKYKKSYRKYIIANNQADDSINRHHKNFRPPAFRLVRYFGFFKLLFHCHGCSP